MSHGVLVERALKRREVFKRLQEHLETVKRVVYRLDSKAEISFSVPSRRVGIITQAIDILVVTETPPAKVLSELWKAGIKEPFEVHVHLPEKAALYKDRAKLLRI